jgi:hypothetical protein
VQESNVAGAVWKKEESIYYYLPFPVDWFYDPLIFPAEVAFSSVHNHYNGKNDES